VIDVLQRASGRSVLDLLGDLLAGVNQGRPVTVG
jgi:hypothetical protein